MNGGNRKKILTNLSGKSCYKDDDGNPGGVAQHHDSKNHHRQRTSREKVGNVDSDHEEGWKSMTILVPSVTYLHFFYSIYGLGTSGVGASESAIWILIWTCYESDLQICDHCAEPVVSALVRLDFLRFLEEPRSEVTQGLAFALDLRLFLFFFSLALSFLDDFPQHHSLAFIFELVANLNY